MADRIPGNQAASRPSADGLVTGESKPRVTWMDTARGITMVLVVLLHADSVTQQIGNQVLVVTLFDYALFPLRMPMFFLVSGLLSAGLLRRSAGEVIRRRVLHYAWLYPLWLGIYALAHAWALRHLGSPALQEVYVKVESPASALLITWNNVWFLYALMLFYAMALLLRRLPVAVQATLALALAVPGLLHLGYAIGLPVIDRFYHFPYFMLGILGGERLRDAVPRLGRLRIVLPLAITCLALAALAHHQRILREPAVVAALSLIAMPVELGLSVWLAQRVPRLAGLLQVVGRNTLAVYVLHTITLRLVLSLVPAPGGLADIPWVLGVTLAAVALALCLGKILEPIPGLFGIPRLPRRRKAIPKERVAGVA